MRMRSHGPVLAGAAARRPPGTRGRRGSGRHPPRPRAARRGRRRRPGLAHGYRVPGGPGRGRPDPLGGTRLRRWRLRRRLAGQRVHRRPRGKRGRRGRRRPAAHLVRPGRRCAGLRRVDAGRGPGRRRPDRRAQRRPAAQRRDQGRGPGPGDPGLITVRGRQLLAEADVVLTDRLAPRSLLDELPADVEIIDVSKIPYGRAMPQDQINAILIERARAGRFVARLKGGDPFVFGRGAEEALACLRAGVPVTVVPGVTSAVGVPTSVWLPVTHRGVAQEFHVVSVHVPPGDVRSTVDWALLGGSTGTLVLLMSVQRIGAIAAELLRHGRSPDTPVSVIADGTMPTQRTINSSLEQVEDMVTREGIRPPAIVVVGDVVDVAVEITELMRDVTAW